MRTFDWHAVHYVKIIMDEIFGRENFINEIIWTYKSGGSSRKKFFEETRYAAALRQERKV